MREQYLGMQNSVSPNTTTNKERKVSTSRMATDQGNLFLKTNIWSFPDMGMEDLNLNLINEQGDGMGEYVVRRKGTNWNLHHRSVPETYRGKNIGKELLEATENCV